MSEDTFNIYDLLDEMREKPAMYLGVKSLRLLQAYTDGHMFALYQRGLKETSSPPFYREFNDWTAERLGYEYSTAGWCNIILANTLGWSPKHHKWAKLMQSVKPADEAAALDRFYELLDEYRRKYAEQKAG